MGGQGCGGQFGFGLPDATAASIANRDRAVYSRILFFTFAPPPMMSAGGIMLRFCFAATHKLNCSGFFSNRVGWASTKAILFLAISQYSGDISKPRK